MKAPKFTSGQIKYLKEYNDRVTTLVAMCDRLFERNVDQNTRQYFENALHKVKECLK